MDGRTTQKFEKRTRAPWGQMPPEIMEWIQELDPTTNQFDTWGSKMQSDGNFRPWTGDHGKPMDGSLTYMLRFIMTKYKKLEGSARPVSMIHDNSPPAYPSQLANDFAPDFLVPPYTGEHHVEIIITPTPNSEYPVKIIDTSSDEVIAASLQSDDWQDDVSKITPRKVADEKPAQATPRQNPTKTLPTTPSRSSVAPAIIHHPSSPAYTSGGPSADWTLYDNDLALRKIIIDASSNKHSYSTLHGLRREYLINILKSYGGKMVS